MAGELETWRGPPACNVRVMLDIYVPRIRLEFRLTSRDGKVVSSGSGELSDPLYLTRAGLLATDPLRYEKNLLRDWLERVLRPFHLGKSRRRLALGPFPRGPDAVLCGLQ